MAAPTKICCGCGLETPKMEFYGRPWCASCEEKYAAELRAEKIQQVNEARYRQRKAEGRCQSCGEAARPGRARCEACARKYNERARLKRRRSRVP